MALFLSIATLILGIEFQGLKRFISIGGISVNTGYWILLFYIFFLASKKQGNSIVEKQETRKYTMISIITEVIVTVAILYLILSFMEKHIFFILIALIIIYLFLVNKKSLGIGVTVLLFSLFAYIFISNHSISERITGYYSHNGNSHQVQQCLNSFEYGGIFGIGFINTQRSLADGNLLPESLGHTTFAVFIEHFGILGGLLLIASFTYLVYYGLKIIKKFNEDSLALVIILLLFVFIVFSIAHILNCLNVFPFGAMLSFFSIGRDFNIVTMITAGLIYKGNQSKVLVNNTFINS
jgi:cell division protein FtsW (lipid II flippase)